MSGMNQVLERAVAAQDVPFAVGMAADADGVRYSGAVGDAAPGRPAGEDTVFRIFSMTKAIGAVAAMILIDRGKMGFDTPVADILPEFARVQVLDGFDGDTPILRAPKTQATLRHLATHTSGLEYEFWNGDVARYMEATGHPTILSGLKASLFYPMMTDPGTRWGYGVGIDWLGQVVEAVDGRRIDAFCREEIFEPLDMANTAFELDDAMTANLCELVGARRGRRLRPVRAGAAVATGNVWHGPQPLFDRAGLCALPAHGAAQGRVGRQPHPVRTGGRRHDSGPYAGAGL